MCASLDDLHVVSKPNPCPLRFAGRQRRSNSTNKNSHVPKGDGRDGLDVQAPLIENVGDTCWHR